MDPSTNQTNETVDYSSWETISKFNLFWQIPVDVAIVFLNSLLVYALVFKIKNRTFSNLCYFSLLICDLFVGLLTLPTYIYTLYSGQALNFYLGIVIVINQYAQPTISLFTLIVLGCHRIFLLVFPQNSNEVITKSKLLVLFGIWIVLYAIISLIVIVFAHIGYYDASVPDIIPPEICVVVFDVLFLELPILVNISLTLAMIVLIKKRMIFSIRIKTLFVPDKSSRKPINLLKNCHERKNSPRSSNVVQRRDVKAITCLSSIILTLVATKIMAMFAWPLGYMGIITDLNFLMATNWISYCTSLTNAVIMILFHDTIRSATCKIFFRRWRFFCWFIEL